MPNPRRPDALKVISGTTRADREKPLDVDYDLVEEFPDAPQHLNVDGREMWSRLGPTLVKHKVLQVTDLFCLEQLCIAWQLFRKSAKADMPITASENNALLSMFSAFGMTPAARSKIRLGEKDAKPANAFTRNGKQNKAA